MRSAIGVVLGGVMLAAVCGCNDGLPADDGRRDLRAPATDDLGFDEPDLGAPADLLGEVADLEPAPDLSAPARTLTFAAGVSYRLAPMADPAGLVTADVNTDGRPDVVVTSKRDYQVHALLGDGRGGLLAPVDRAVPLLTDGLAAGDLDGDGKLDLVVTSTGQGGLLNVLRGHDDGTFDGPSAFPLSITGLGVVLADLDNDTHLDAAVVGLQGGVDVLYGRGDGSLNPASHVGGRIGPAETLAAGDLDGDGRPELVVASSHLYVLPGINLQGNPFDYPAGRSARSPVLVDLNRDGKLDVVATDNDAQAPSGVSVLLNQGAFLAAAVGHTAPKPSRMAVAADFDGDRRIDLAVVQGGKGPVGVLVGDGRGGFALPAGFGDVAGGYAIATADLDRDGLPDLVVTDVELPGLIVYLNTSR